MKRLSILLLFATSVAAQTADLRVTIDVATRPVAPGTVIPYAVTLENLGPDAATNVVFVAGANHDVCTDQRIPSLPAGERRVVDCQAVPPFAESAVAVAASASSADFSDPDPANNQAVVHIRVVTPADLHVYSFPDPVVDAGLPYTLHVGYANRAHNDAKDVTIVLFDVGGAGRLPDNCTIAGNNVTCVIGDLPGMPLGGFPDFRTLAVELLAPDASNLQIPIKLQIRGDGDDLRPEDNIFETSTRTYRTFFVTNTNDDGSGCLRAAMHEANASCREAGYCKIAFRIPPTAARWQTITPRSPLPLLVAPSIDIDALVQSRYFTDTNELGPDIEISGAGLTSGHAIDFACSANIRGLAINGFPGSALQSTRATCAKPDVTRINLTSIAEHNYLGTDPTGMTAIPNGRGITLQFGGLSVIANNIISGNRRSGVFIESGDTIIMRNIIGLTRGPSAGLGNGASGIYLGPLSTGSDVTNNYIGFNEHFGISVHPQSRYNAFEGNSFQANHNLAIDFGLDGPTGLVPDASNNGFVSMPEITSARYDAVLDQTIIEGSSKTANDRHEVWVNLYANDERDPSGFGEGQYYVGMVKARQDQTFRFTMKGRPPGRWLAGTTTRINIIGLGRTPEVQSICSCGFTSTTSEFGRTVELIE